MKIKAICLYEQDPEIHSQILKMNQVRDEHERELKNLVEIAEQKSKFFDKTMNSLHSELVEIARRKKLLPDWYRIGDSENHLSVDVECGTLAAIKEEKGDKEPSAILKKILERLTKK